MRLGELHVHAWGDPSAPSAPPLLALHGIKGYGGRWRRFAETHLPDMHVLAPDLRGHGRSTSEPPWGVERHVADLLAVLDRLEIARIDVLGHSFGGLLAIHLSRAAPERVGRLVLLDPSVQLPPRSLHKQARTAMSPPSFGTRDDARADRAAAWPDASVHVLDDEVAGHLVQGPDGRWRWRVDGAAVVTTCSEMARPQVLPAPGTETLLVIARRSGFVRPEFVAACQDALGELLTVAEVDADHMLYLEQPEQTGPLVRRFLTESRPRPNAGQASAGRPTAG